MNKSESIANLAVALVKIQTKLPKVKFDSVNPFIGNGYASLSAVMDASVPVMAELGLTIVQFPVSTVEAGREQIGVRTILIHESGEFIEDAVYVPFETKKGLSGNQVAGVTITYLKRYGRAAVLGLITEEDTDGDDNPASAQNAKANKAVSEVMKKRQWSNEQTQAISVMALDAGLDPLSRDDSADILDYSTLPGDAPVKTIQSWFKHYMKTEGTVLDKAQSANEAYNKAKNGGK